MGPKSASYALVYPKEWHAKRYWYFMGDSPMTWAWSQGVVLWLVNKGLRRMGTVNGRQNLQNAPKKIAQGLICFLGVNSMGEL